MMSCFNLIHRPAQLDGLLAFAARSRSYAGLAWRWIVLRRPAPFIYGIVVTDCCNLHCRGCKVANTGRPGFTWEHLLAVMNDARHRGFRELYFTGGEPMLWRDGEHGINDAILFARQIGFFHVHLYTNGTFGLNTSADLVWVSMDGLPDSFQLRRGNCFDQVEANIRSALHQRIAVIYTIDHNTAAGIEPFLRWVVATNLPVIGVMFYFHTPYYGYDELYLDSRQRAPIIDRLLHCVDDRLPVLNSRAGLLALKSGRWPRRLPIVRLADVDGEYVCCRASNETCAVCGYAACTELAVARRLCPSALVNLMHYW